MSDRMDQQVKFWCHPSQRKEWDKAADLAKRSFSDWARIILDEAAAKLIAEAEAEGKKPKK